MMAKLMTLVLLLFTLYVCSAPETCAQTTEFTFQGSLKDGAIPANGNYDFEFLLFDSLNGGTQLGATLTRSGVAVAGGIFSVSLDFGGQFPGANRFLEIHVRITGGGAFTPLTPRQAINSSPYSIRSLDASQLGGIAASQYVLTGDARLSDARNPLPNSSNYIQNTTSQQSSSNFNISGNGVVGGTLGIGTTNPAGSLHVRGTNPVRILGDTLTLSGSEFVDFMARSSIFSSDLGGMRIQRQPATGNIDTLFFTAAAGNSASEKMRVTGDGNVGIGTTTPAARLAVRGDGTDVLLGSAGCGAPTAAIGFGTMTGCTNFALGGNIDPGAAAGTFLNRPAGRSLHFRENNGPDQMTIAPGGNVGIGTTNPSWKLTVRADPADPPNGRMFVLQNSAGADTLVASNNGVLEIKTLYFSSTTHACYFGTYIFAACSSAAEYVPTIDDGTGFAQAADLVSIAPTIKNPYDDEHSPFVVTKSAKACDDNLLGFIVNPESGADGKKLNDHYLPLAIYGYFPAKVTLENGAIKRGDPITSSSKPGYGMKATQACKIVGYALEDAEQEGKIQVFAHLSEYTAPQVAALQAQVEQLRREGAAREARLAALESAVQHRPKP